MTEEEVAERLFELDRTPLPKRIDDLLGDYAAEFTEDCLHPGEVADAPTFADLPPDRQAHVRTCELCSLIVGGEDAVARPVGPRPARVADAAAAARAAAPSTLWQRFAAVVFAILGSLALWKYLRRSAT